MPSERDILIMSELFISITGVSSSNEDPPTVQINFGVSIIISSGQEVNNNNDAAKR